VDKKGSMILQIALDTPLRRVFDYRPPAAWAGIGPNGAPQLGVRVRVPFGRRQLIGVLVGIAAESVIDAEKLKSALDILDQQPIFDPVTFELLRWAAEYYHHPIGEVFAAALPVSLRTGEAARHSTVWWSLSDVGRQEMAAPSDRRAPQQRALLAWLDQRGRASADDLDETFKPAQLRTLAARGWIRSHSDAAGAAPGDQSGAISGANRDSNVIQTLPSDLGLTEHQAHCVAAILASLPGFAAHLLYGVTGSGKTEVYLRVIAAAIASGGQALVLVPEIALTPQLVDRFRRRFSAGVVAVHSGLTGVERRDAWRAAHSGEARIIIGTRSAVFTSLPKLALVVVDEEHDASYKQHEGFRYSARDLAVVRAQRAGRAHRARLGNSHRSKRWRTLRPGAIRSCACRTGPARRRRRKWRWWTCASMAATRDCRRPRCSRWRGILKAGGQVIVFLNRRGYAPSLFCNACGWVAPCAHCDARMTLHRRAQQLRCHHCGAHAAVPVICGKCGQPLNPVGQGTERVEETLARLFPEAPLARLDRDTASARGAVQSVLERVHSGEARILVGTQMLTKGHHFPEVTPGGDPGRRPGVVRQRFSRHRASRADHHAGRRARRTRTARRRSHDSNRVPEHPLLNGCSPKAMRDSR
jgi:primosomal protein N' (replication factor Y)